MTHPEKSNGHSDARLVLRTLGAFELCHAQATGGVTVFGPGKPLALITYLSVTPGHSTRRETLFDLLWAEDDPDSAAHNCRQTLWYIRQRCGPGFVVASDGNVALGKPPLSDRNEFLAAVERRDLAEAVSLYLGDFLPSFAAPGGADFEKWADLERDQLRSTFGRTADALVRQYLGASRHRDAVALARRICATLPHEEAPRRLLLESLVSSGDWLTAAAEADGMEQWLARTSREPQAATRAALAAARQCPLPDASPAPSALVAELVGRQSEFRTIVDAWDAVRRGASRHVHIMGPAGLGKSRLLGDSANRVRALGGRCVTVRPTQAGQLIHGGVIADIAAELTMLKGAMSISLSAAGTLVALNPSLSNRFPAAHADHAGGDEALRRRVLAITELAGAIADEAPFALIVDDVHWIDGYSRQVLNAVLERLGAHAVLLLTAARPVPDGIMERQHSELFVLKPLSVPETSSLIASIGQLPSEDWASRLPERLHDATGGVPLLVLETIQLAIERGALSLRDRTWSGDQPALLDRLLAEGGALRQRIAGLDRDCGWLLFVSSLAGAPLETSILVAIGGRQPALIAKDLTELEHMGLLARSGTTWTTAHDSIADTAIALATDDAVHAAHFAIGRVLAEPPDAGDAVLIRAGRHLAMAKSDAHVRWAFRRLVESESARHDAKSMRALAARLLGEDGGSQNVDALLRSLPLATRVSRTAVWRAAAVVALLLTGAVVLQARGRAGGIPPIEILTWRVVGDSFQAASLALSSEELENGDTIHLRRARAIGDLPLLANVRQMLLPQPGGRLWTSWAAFEGARTNIDMTLIEDGRERRLLEAPGDDGAEDWAPDGSALLYYTDRYDSTSQGDQEVYDLRSGTRLRLTGGPARETSGSWAWDGTRIAWIRSNQTSAATSALCWTTVDARRQKCTRHLELNFVAILGWLNESEVIVVTETGDGATNIGLFNLESEAFRQSFLGRNSGLASGPWILCRCAPRTSGSRAPSLRNVVNTDLQFFLAEDSVSGQAVLMQPPRRFVDTVRIVTPPGDELAAGMPAFQLGLRTVDNRGREVTIVRDVVMWQSSDTMVLRVDSLGMITPLRAGSATVTASAGGWRSDARLILVTGQRQAITRLDESWNIDWPSRWMPFGVPRPVVLPGPWFWHRGDSSHASGAHTREGWSGEQGISLQATIWPDVRDTHWQSLGIGFQTITDTAAMKAWDHFTGSWHYGREDSDRSCSFVVPGGEGENRRLAVGSSGGDLSRRDSIPPSLLRQPFTVRVQITADGSCVTMLNGGPLRRLPSAIPLDLPFHVWIQGLSHRTRMLVGPLTVRTGDAAEGNTAHR